MHDRSLEMKRKGHEDFLQHQSRFRSTMTQSFRRDDNDYNSKVFERALRKAANATPDKTKTEVNFIVAKDVLSPYPINEKAVIKNYNKLMTIQQK